MKKLYRQIISVFLLVMLSFAIVPVEFIHDLYGHEDTVDVLLPNGAASIETAHHHCAILKIEFPQYLRDEGQPDFMCGVVPGYRFIVYHNPYLSVIRHTIGQRGPPSLLV